MRRREFIALLGVAGAWPLAARAQQPPTKLRVGVASVQPRSAPIYATFLKGMAELGYEEGKNFIFEFVQAPNTEGYAAPFQEVARRNVDILMATGPEIGLKAAIAAAGTRPIVMIAIDFDPLALGVYVASLARPGDNITGLFVEQVQLSVKRLQLLTDAFPSCQVRLCFGIRYQPINGEHWSARRQPENFMSVELNFTRGHTTTRRHLPKRRQRIVVP